MIPKSGLALLIGKMKPKSEGADDGPEDGSGYEAGLTAASADILAAIKANDAKQLAAGLQSFFEQCDAMPHEEGEHE